MTAAERAAALEAYGFTPRRAAFVATVLLHGGVCVPRQYCAFAGITRGKVVQEFFATLTTRRLATVYRSAARDHTRTTSITRRSTGPSASRTVAIDDAPASNARSNG